MIAATMKIIPSPTSGAAWRRSARASAGWLPRAIMERRRGTRSLLL